MSVTTKGRDPKIPTRRNLGIVRVKVNRLATNTKKVTLRESEIAVVAEQVERRAIRIDRSRFAIAVNDKLLCYK
jgi:hypothetical protein